MNSRKKLTFNGRKSHGWIGPPVKGKSRRGKAYYGGLLIGNEVISVGDYVFIDSEQDELSYVAQVIDLYNNELADPGADDNRRAVVQWYMRPNELKERVRDVRLLPEGADFSSTSEVYLYESKSDRITEREIDADTIICKCKIVKIPADSSLPKETSDDGIPVLYVRWSYDGYFCKPVIQPKVNRIRKDLGVTPGKTPSKKRDVKRQEGSKVNGAERSLKTPKIRVCKESAKSKTPKNENKSPGHRANLSDVDLIEELFSGEEADDIINFIDLPKRTPLQKRQANKKHDKPFFNQKDSL